MTPSRNGYSKLRFATSASNGDIPTASNGHSVKLSDLLKTDGGGGGTGGGVGLLTTNRLVVGVHGQRRLLLAVVVALTFFVLVFTNMRYYQTRPNDYRLFYSTFPGDSDVESNLVRPQNKADGKCHLPQLDPYDPSITSFLQKPEPLECKKLQAELTYITDEEDSRLALNTSAIEEERFTTAITCEYRCFDRTEGLNDVTLTYGPWIRINETRGEPISFAPDSCPFLDVACSRSFGVNIPVYSNTHCRVIVERDRLARLDRIRRGEQHRAATSSSAAAADDPNSGTPYSSVLLFILDSISHSNFVRSLPKTLNVLRTLYDATVFDGFTKTGDNSLPNAMAFLAGLRVQTAGYTSDVDDDMSRRFYDDWPFVWKEYARRGYATMYAEDYPKYNLFQYMSNGFRRRPVDHYFRPFWVHAWSSFLHMRSTHLCYGNTPKHRLQLDYLRRVILMHSRASRPLFAFNWMTELGHDWMNQVGVGDEDLADFFTRMRPYLNNTLVTVLSDHGHRFDSIRQTVIGRIEERMPFFAVSLPSAWRATRPEVYANLRRTLQRNAKILTSPFDLHATLGHFLRLNVGATADQSHGDADESPKSKNGTRGSSLFDPLPPDRQCDEADVPEEFCVCQQEVLVANASTDEKVQRASAAVLEHMNRLLAPVAEQCSPLRLGRIRHAQTFLPNLNAIEDQRVSIIYGGRRPSGFYVNYRVTLVTEPGDGVFEAAVRYSLTEDTFNVIGDINRINKYGNQSDCIQSVLLRKYCFCQSTSSSAVVSDSSTNSSTSDAAV